MVRTVLSLCLALGVGGSVLLAQETKQEKGAQKAKKEEGPIGQIGRYSPKSKTIALAGGSALLKYKLKDDAKVIDANGEESKDGLKDKRLAVGTRVQLVLEAGGKGVTEIRLLTVSSSGRSRNRQAGRPGQDDTKSKDGKTKGDEKKSDEKKSDEKKDKKSGDK